jgi:mono/diheme cytochrome c family protein
MKRDAQISLFVLACALPLVLGGAKVAWAQDSAPSDQEQLGARLFNQSCNVCHLKQQIGTTTYAPPLSKDTLNGKSDVIRDVIMNGTPRMPSFKTQFTPARIDAIVAYIKTIPAPSAAPPPAKAHGAGEPD